ncbi:MAG: hypothetical protein ACK4I8_12185, partial [Armatimonadota bacterium]
FVASGFYPRRPLIATTILLISNCRRPQGATLPSFSLILGSVGALSPTVVNCQSEGGSPEPPKNGVKDDASVGGKSALRRCAL